VAQKGYIGATYLNTTNVSVQDDRGDGQPVTYTDLNTTNVSVQVRKIGLLCNMHFLS
jgi:hypothetical protein